MPRLNHSRVLLLAALAALPAGASAQTTPPPALAASEIAASDVPQLVATLNGAQTPQEDRDTAARRLLGRPDPAALAAIVAALDNNAQRGAQLAAARALSLSPRAEPALIPPLLAMLSTATTRPPVEAAAKALTAFKTSDEVLTRLLAVARGGNETARVAAIAAAGTFTDKRVAAAMIELVDADVPATRAAARNALAYLSGLDAATTDGDQWRAWWAENVNKPDAQFRSDLAAARALRYDQARNDLNALADDLGQMLRQQYRSTPSDRQPEMVLQYLKSPSPVVRRIGCAIAADIAGDGRLPTAVQAQLRTLIGDASPEVRREAAAAMGPLNDAEAFVPLLTQLQQETDPAARVAIATALRPYKDPRAVPVLLRLLDDNRLDAVQAAAWALSGEMGVALRAADPAAADAAAEKIFAAMTRLTTPLKNQELRDYLIRAITPLQARQLAGRLNAMLTGQGNREPERIRVSLLGALGEMRDPKLADSIAASLNDPQPDVRVAAIRGLGKVSNSAEWGERIFERTDATKEEVALVRQEAWELMKQLFGKATNRQLGAYAQKLRGEAGRQIVVLRVLRDREEAAGNAAAVATLQQQIGDAAAKIKQYDEAIVSYRAAIDYFRKQPAGGPNEEIVSQSLMEALLWAKRYPEAITFAQQQLARDRKFNNMVITPIKSAAERLINVEKDLESARQLIEMAAKLPNLSTLQASNFKDLSGVIDERLRQQNRLPSPRETYPQSAQRPRQASPAAVLL
ncbi:MAG TPA: HEAT repeat domain-containing protein [Tepidisphaeraceae bacterium]